MFFPVWSWHYQQNRFWVWVSSCFLLDPNMLPPSCPCFALWNSADSSFPWQQGDVVWSATAGGSYSHPLVWAYTVSAYPQAWGQNKGLHVKQLWGGRPIKHLQLETNVARPCRVTLYISRAKWQTNCGAFTESSGNQFYKDLCLFYRYTVTHTLSAFTEFITCLLCTIPGCFG